MPYELLPSDLLPQNDVIIDLSTRLANPHDHTPILQADLPLAIVVGDYRLFFDFMQDAPPDPADIPEPCFHLDHPNEPRPCARQPQWALFVNLSSDPNEELTVPYADISVDNTDLVTDCIAARSQLRDDIVPGRSLNYISTPARLGRTARGILMPLGAVLHVDCGPTTDFGVAMARYSMRVEDRGTM